MPSYPWTRDADCSQAVVEAALIARKFYEKAGYKVIKYVKIGYPPKWEGRPESELYWMIRPAKKDRI